MLGAWKPSTLHLILFAAGGGSVYLGQEWGTPWATEIGTAILGVLFVAAGFEIILKRLGSFRIEGWTRYEAAETYRGVAEVLWGAIFVCLGLIMAAVAVLKLVAPASAGDFWSAWPTSKMGIGVILAIVGALTLLNGLVRALAGSGRVDPGRLGGLPSALDRLAGAATALLGMLLSAIGLMLLMMAPEAVTAMLGQVRNLFAGG